MKRILFVDDEPKVLTAACNSLRARRTEWEAVVAIDAEDALDALEKGPAFDAIVCDLHMPGAGGETLLRVVAGQYPNVKRVVLTGDLHPQTAARVSPLCDVFLEKPCGAEELQKALQRLFEKAA